MLKLIENKISWFATGSAGASLIELSVSLLLISVVGVGLAGTVAVGAQVGAAIEERDASLTTSRSQAEFIASQPAASSYSDFPALPSALDLTSDVTNECQGRDFLQCITIRVSRDGDEISDLEILKAQRFVATGGVPTSGGLERVKPIVVPQLPGEEGFAVVISDLFSSFTPTHILVRWEVSPDTQQEGRTLAI